MVYYILYSFHVVTMTTMEVHHSQIGSVCLQVEHTLLKLFGVHAGLLKESLKYKIIFCCICVYQQLLVTNSTHYHKHICFLSLFNIHHKV